jgi:hypothetical protein
MEEFCCGGFLQLPVRSVPQNCSLAGLRSRFNFFRKPIPWDWQVICFIHRQIVHMKFVTLVISAMIISFNAAAQTTGHAAQKRTAAKVQQKAQGRKAKSFTPKATAEDADVTTLKDERAYKAKWSFEEILKRRQEIDAENGAGKLTKQ